MTRGMSFREAVATREHLAEPLDLSLLPVHESISLVYDLVLAVVLLANVVFHRLPSTGYGTSETDIPCQVNHRIDLKVV